MQKSWTEKPGPTLDPFFFKFWKKKIDMIEKDICLGGASKENVLSSVKCASKKKLMGNSVW